MTVTEINLLVEKAKNRKDGIYSFRGNLWVCKDNFFVGFADYYGNIYARRGSFNQVLGAVNKYDRKIKLKYIFLK